MVFYQCKRTFGMLFPIVPGMMKIQTLSNDFDIEQLHCNVIALKKIASGDKDGGPIGEMDIPSRFRWLTAIRSSAIQTSRPHSGLCEDLEKTIQRLFEELVL